MPEKLQGNNEEMGPFLGPPQIPTRMCWVNLGGLLGGIWQTEAVSPVLPQALGTTALGVPKDIPSGAWRGGREPQVRYLQR